MTSDRSERPLGEGIRALRRARGFTGKQLADLVGGMSQSRISRLENGVGPAPSPEIVGRLAEVLGATPDVVHELIEQATRLQEPGPDWAGTVPDLELRQHDTEQLEHDAVDFKVFQPAIVIGLLQTSGYAEAVLKAMRLALPPEAAAGRNSDIYGAVVARVHRQRVLLDGTKHFDFVMSEAVFTNRICPPEEMLVQIRRIVSVAQQSNVTLGIVPASVNWPVPPLHGFSVLDNRHLLVDLFDTGIAKHDEYEAGQYANVFAAIKGEAVVDVESILDKHRQRYVRELQAD